MGGETAARFDANTSLVADGVKLQVRAAELDEQSTLDLKKFYGKDTDSRAAYAYAEWSAPQAERILAIFGSDDGAAVWLNGKKVHRVGQHRGLDPDSDRFMLTVAAGTNRLLIKVDNAGGGWGFALRMLDEKGQGQLALHTVRRHLEALGPVPVARNYLLESSFPKLDWNWVGASTAIFGSSPIHVHWFDPEGAPAEDPLRDGQYTAVVEATTTDGYTYRRALTFAKVSDDTLQRYPAPPALEMPPVAIPGYWPFNRAQRADLSRYFWHGASVAMAEGPTSAIASLSLKRLSAEPEGPESTSWHKSGFVQAFEHTLKLRLQLDGREPHPLKPPQALAVPAPELRRGSEAAAGMQPGTTDKLRKVAREWAKADPNPFVVLVAGRGVVFLHEGYNGHRPDSLFMPASIGKSVSGLVFARAVDQGVLSLDQPVGTVLPEWKHPHTASVTFRHCFNHVTGLTGHASHGGLFNAYLDNALLAQDAAFVQPGTRRIYNGDGFNLAIFALEAATGQPFWRQHEEFLQKPLGEESVTQFDAGFGSGFNAMYLAKLGQMILQDGQYGQTQFFSPHFLETLLPRKVAQFAPALDDQDLEEGIGLEWMTDPPGPREQGVLGSNVIGHGASSGSVWRVDPAHQVVIVIGRSGFLKNDWDAQNRWTTKFVKAVADGLSKNAPPPKAISAAPSGGHP